jgi:predicted GNAT family N-acyltransferase
MVATSRGAAATIGRYPKTPQRRGSGIGDLLLDELFVRLRGTVDEMCTNVHLRNPAQNLYQRKGFRMVGQGRGPLGVAMHKDLRVRP